MGLTGHTRYAVEYPAENGFGIGVYSGNGRLIGIHLAGTGAIELLGATLSQAHIPMLPHPCLAEIVLKTANDFL